MAYLKFPPVGNFRYEVEIGRQNLNRIIFFDLPFKYEITRKVTSKSPGSPQFLKSGPRRLLFIVHSTTQTLLRLRLGRHQLRSTAVRNYTCSLQPQCRVLPVAQCRVAFVPIL